MPARFYLGEIYENQQQPSGSRARQAIVVAISSSGQTARLGFLDGDEQCELRWSELLNGSPWRRVDDAA